MTSSVGGGWFTLAGADIIALWAEAFFYFRTECAVSDAEVVRKFLEISRFPKRRIFKVHYSLPFLAV